MLLFSRKDLLIWFPFKKIAHGAPLTLKNLHTSHLILQGGSYESL